MEDIIKSIPIVRSLFRNYNQWKFRREWRMKNSHNQMHVGYLVFPVNSVSVGKYSYGMLNIYNYNPSVEQLIIGNFVSIAPGVSFLLGENHQIDTVSSFPMYSTLYHEHYHKDTESNGPITVEDEVWIGMNSIILSGVNISKGAIVAAGSVVTRSVPPYAIVGGNPARIIKYRFSEDIITELMKINLLDYPEWLIKENINLFYKKILSVEDVKSFVELMNKRLYENE
jgi:acetyltransferase-like isoleucine patch superfamily enzyme